MAAMINTEVYFVLTWFKLGSEQCVEVNNDGLIDCEMENMPIGVFFSLKVGKRFYSSGLPANLSFTNGILIVSTSASKNKPKQAVTFNNVYASLEQVKINGKLTLTLACAMERQQADGLLDFLCQHCGYER